MSTDPAVNVLPESVEQEKPTFVRTLGPLDHRNADKTWSAYSYLFLFKEDGDDYYVGFARKNHDNQRPGTTANAFAAAKARLADKAVRIHIKGGAAAHRAAQGMSQSLSSSMLASLMYSLDHYCRRLTDEYFTKNTSKYQTVCARLAAATGRLAIESTRGTQSRKKAALTAISNAVSLIAEIIASPISVREGEDPAPKQAKRDEYLAHLEDLIASAKVAVSRA
jgi:hypothetical protein